MENDKLERTIQALRRLPPEGQRLVIELVAQLAKGVGVSMAPIEYRPPIENVPLWVARLRIEHRSEKPKTKKLSRAKRKAKSPDDQ